MFVCGEKENKKRKIQRGLEENCTFREEKETQSEEKQRKSGNIKKKEKEKESKKKNLCYDRIVAFCNAAMAIFPTKKRHFLSAKFAPPL